ncbi:MAG: AAA family ATPase [Acidobacteriota bacterium]
MNKIIIPDNSLVVLCGIAGCGKSTFAAKHFLPTQIVSSDGCRAMLSDDESNQKVTGHAFELWRFIIRKRLFLNRLSVADATNLERGDRVWLTKTAAYHNFYTTAVIFDIPFAVCIERNASRHRVVPEEALARQYSMLQETLRSIKDEAFDFVFVINEKSQSLVEVEVAQSGIKKSAEQTEITEQTESI